MTQLLKRIGLGMLAAFGLYLTVIVGAFLAGVILGFTSTYKSPPVTITRYRDCSVAPAPPECAALAKGQPAHLAP